MTVDLAAMLEGPLEATSEGILLLDLEGNVVWFNRRVNELFGITPDIVRGATRARLIAGMRQRVVDADAYEARVAEIIASDENNARDVLRLKSGRALERISRHHVLAGQRVGRMLMYRDVTREQQVAKALEHSEARFRDVIAGAPDGIVLSQTWRIAYANAAFANAVCRRANDLVGTNLLDLMPEEDRHRVHTTAMRIMDREERGSVQERRFVRPDGHIVHFEVAALRIELEGEPTMVLFMRDLTERRRLAAQLAVSDRMGAIGAMAAGIAHEINNPLAYVIANLELMSAQLSALAEGHDERVDALEKMRGLATEGCQRIKAVVGDLATLSRTGPSEDTERLLDVRWTLDPSLNLARALVSSRARIVTEYNEAPLVRANDARLSQVFLNLLRNAAQAIEPGHPDDNEIRIRCGVTGAGHVLVSISDTGRGLPEGDADRIFDPFFTTKPPHEGMGLGLSICQSIVCGLGGRISVVRNAPPPGTTFHIELPPRP